MLIVTAIIDLVYDSILALIVHRTVRPERSGRLRERVVQPAGPVFTWRVGLKEHIFQKL